MSVIEDIKKRLRKETDMFYGEEGPGGHMAGLESDDNTKDALGSVIGRTPPRSPQLENIMDEAEIDRRGIENKDNILLEEEDDDVDDRIPRIEDLVRLDYLD